MGFLALGVAKTPDAEDDRVATAEDVESQVHEVAVFLCLALWRK
jgi:hypothetical protein